MSRMRGWMAVGVGAVTMLLGCAEGDDRPAEAVVPDRGHPDALFHDVRHVGWASDGQSLFVTVDYGGNQEIDRISLGGAFLGPVVRSQGSDGVVHAANQPPFPAFRRR